MNIRLMRREDVPQVMEIGSRLAEAPQWPENAYVKALDPDGSPARIALVADDGQGGISGFLITVLIPPQAELESIGVAPAVQRQGIATGLLTELHAILKEWQITEVMLEVRESNHAARAFYQGLEFRETGRRNGYYFDPKEDAILLQRTVV